MNEQGQMEEEKVPWGGTPALRTMWTRDLSFFNEESSAALRSAEQSSSEETSSLLGDSGAGPWGGGVRKGGSYGAADDVEDPPYTGQSGSGSSGGKEGGGGGGTGEQGWLSSCFLGTPGLLIATVLNLFLSMSFGQVCYMYVCMYVL
jgi:hypothetical protein